MPVESLHPKMTASAGAPDAAMLSDGDLEKTTKLPIPKAGESNWIQYEFAQPQTIRSLTIVTKGVDFITAMVAGISNPEKSLEASDDGQTFRQVVKLPEAALPQHTLSFPPVTREVFPRHFQAHASTSGAGVGERHRSRFAGDKDRRASDRLRNCRVGACIRERASTASKKKPPSLLCPMSMSSRPLRSRQTKPFQNPMSVDLTSKMRADGTLDWTPPAGNWVVLRFGYSLLGITNHPATAEATGLEVDKLNSRLREELHGRLSRQLQGDGRRGLHGQARHPLRDYR